MQINPLSLIVASLTFALIPIGIGICTSYLKVSIVLGVIKNALGTQNTPGSIIVMALSMALTFYIMAPTFSAIWENVLSREELFTKGYSKHLVRELPETVAPLKVFISAHAGEVEKGMFHELRPSEEVDSYMVLIPAFMITELKDAFRMGCLVVIPFLIIDLVVANVLAGLGMYMMSPAVITLPLKLMLFVASDAWILITQNLISSYGG